MVASSLAICLSMAEQLVPLFRQLVWTRCGLSLRDAALLLPPVEKGSKRIRLKGRAKISFLFTLANL